MVIYFIQGNVRQSTGANLTEKFHSDEKDSKYVSSTLYSHFKIRKVKEKAKSSFKTSFPEDTYIGTASGEFTGMHFKDLRLCRFCK